MLFLGRLPHAEVSTTVLRFIFIMWIGLARIRPTKAFSVSSRGQQAFRHSPWTSQCHYFHSTTCLRLNRFLFDPNELDPQNGEGNDDEMPTPTVTIPKDDYRTIHAAKILGLRNGDTVRAGIVMDSTYNDD